MIRCQTCTHQIYAEEDDRYGKYLTICNNCLDLTHLETKLEPEAFEFPDFNYVIRFKGEK